MMLKKVRVSFGGITQEFMVESQTEEYEEFFKNIKEIEENEKCPNCKQPYALVHCSVEPYEYLFLCRKCGEHFIIEPNYKEVKEND